MPRLTTSPQLSRLCFLAPLHLAVQHHAPVVLCGAAALREQTRGKTPQTFARRFGCAAVPGDAHERDALLPRPEPLAAGLSEDIRPPLGGAVALPEAEKRVQEAPQRRRLRGAETPHLRVAGGEQRNRRPRGLRRRR